MGIGALVTNYGYSTQLYQKQLLPAAATKKSNESPNTVGMCKSTQVNEQQVSSEQYMNNMRFCKKTSKQLNY